MGDATDHSEPECTIYVEITNLAASALAATVCFVIAQLLQQVSLIPVFALYFFELFPESDFSKNVMKILDALGAEKDELKSAVREKISKISHQMDLDSSQSGSDAKSEDAGSRAPEGSHIDDSQTGGPAAIDMPAPDVAADVDAVDVSCLTVVSVSEPAAKKTTTRTTRVHMETITRVETCDLPLGSSAPNPRLLLRTATRRTLLKMENAVRDFKIPLGNFLTIDFHGYVLATSCIYCSTTMVTVAFIIWDSETISHWYDGGFQRTLSAYNIYLALSILIGYGTMLLFVKILNEVYTLENLREDGFTLESKSKATADALFWISTVALTIALCIKWPYVIITLYVMAVLLFEVVAIACFATIRHIFFDSLWNVVLAPCLRRLMPRIFVSARSNRIHSPTYFLVFTVVYLMNFVTQMSRKTIKLLVDKISLGINVSFFLYSLVVVTFLLTVKNRDPEIVDVCVSTSTIVVVAGYLGSAFLLFARPILILLYGENLLIHFDVEGDHGGNDHSSHGGAAAKRSSGRHDSKNGREQTEDEETGSIRTAGNALASPVGSGSYIQLSPIDNNDADKIEI